MSQHDQVLSDNNGAAFRADLNAALAALFSNNSGTSEQTTTVAYQFWADTTTGLMKQRNAANTDWLTRWVLSEGQLAAIAKLQGGDYDSFTATLTGTEYAATPSPAITAYAANQRFNMIFGSACPAAPTLKLNGIATPPNLVRQLNDGTYQNLAVNAFPAGWQSPVKLVSATQALVMFIPPRRFEVTATRDSSLATGSIAIAGVGFKPRKVVLYANISGTPAWSIGEYNSVGAQHCLSGNWGGVADNVGNSTVSIGLITVSAGNYLNVAWLSFNSDGLTLTYTKSGSPTGTVDLKIVLEE